MIMFSAICTNLTAILQKTLPLIPMGITVKSSTIFNLKKNVNNVSNRNQVAKNVTDWCQFKSDWTSISTVIAKNLCSTIYGFYYRDNHHQFTILKYQSLPNLLSKSTVQYRTRKFDNDKCLFIVGKFTKLNIS